MSNPLARPLELPCGAVLPNRLCKAAISEGLADAANHATPRLETLYRRWAASGPGLLFSGNIQVDPAHLERPLNVVIHDEGGFEALSRLAAAGKSGGAHFWAQLSHTGRQVEAAINPQPLAPSAVELDVLRGAGFNFAKPKAMSEEEIAHAVDQFGFAASQVKAAGFTGVTLHAAHGYLISQFLSPLTNLRRDRWGGPLANRARFLLAVLEAVRAAVGPHFPLGIKLNSSDFQRGGFSSRDCVELVKLLNETGLDLLELSGGSLEQPKVMGFTVKDDGEDGKRQSTLRREAYFLAFAKEVREAAKMPVMVVGGFRSAAAMNEALENGELDLIGIARPMIGDPDSPRRLLAGEIERLPSFEAGLGLLDFMPWNNIQLLRMAEGLEPDPDLTGAQAATAFAAMEGRNLEALLARRRRNASAALELPELGDQG
jgi:2,4-dienoyl-CoA reductase-like NADH-dependent reductase (Old Yellow Enzyme family)